MDLEEFVCLLFLWTWVQLHSFDWFAGFLFLVKSYVVLGFVSVCVCMSVHEIKQNTCVVCAFVVMCVSVHLVCVCVFMCVYVCMYGCMCVV